MTNATTTTSSNNASTGFLSKAEGMAWCGAYALEAALIVSGNLLTIILFAVNKRLRKRSLFLIINMAFADLMLGALYLPFYIYIIGRDYFLWAGKLHISLRVLFSVIDIILSQVSLISAALISCERFFAIYWPQKYRALPRRAYRIVILVVWLLAILVSIVINLLFYLVSYKHATYPWIPYAFTLLLIVCGCNICIWRTFHQGFTVSPRRNSAFQNQRLTKTLLFVSIIALLSWLPFIIMNCIYILELSIPPGVYEFVVLLNFSNSLLNPVVYALRIAEFKLALAQLRFSGKPAVMNVRGNRDEIAMVSCERRTMLSQAAVKEEQTW